MPSPGWPSWRAVTARGPAAPMAWSIGIRSCGWSPRTAGTVHVRWASLSSSQSKNKAPAFNYHTVKNHRHIENMNLFFSPGSIMFFKQVKNIYHRRKIIPAFQYMSTCKESCGNVWQYLERKQLKPKFIYPLSTLFSFPLSSFKIVKIILLILLGERDGEAIRCWVMIEIFKPKTPCFFF